MTSHRGVVLIASAMSDEADGLSALLKEVGFSEILRVENGMRALNTVRSRRIDALLADAVLPELDGVELSGRIRSEALTVYPAVILMRLPGMRLRSGAEDCAVLDKPPTRESLENALERMRPECRKLPAEKSERARALLESVGIPDHCGREYLLKAILIAWQDVRMLRALTTRLYPLVAETFGVEARHAERAMRHAIDAAWRSGEIEAQYRLFGDTIDAKRGSPTCGEMIAQIADILRWEGKA